MPSGALGKDVSALRPEPRRDATEATNDARPHERQSHSLARWLWISCLRSLIVLLIYVLSIGPLYWQWYGSRFAGGSPAAGVFFQPLVILADRIPAFGEWLDWYVGLWIG